MEPPAGFQPAANRLAAGFSTRTEVRGQEVEKAGLLGVSTLVNWPFFISIHILS
jgi:hypothetical protein